MSQFTRTSTVSAVQAALRLPDREGERPPHQAFLIASIDIEKYGWPAEFKPVTEIGIAILDTRDIQALPANASNIDILSRIRCYHLRPKESGHLSNGKNWRGVNFDHARDFDFGHSEWITRDQVENALRKLLQVTSPERPEVVLPVHMIIQGGIRDLEDIGEFATPEFKLVKFSNMEIEDLQDIASAAIRDLGSVGLANITRTLGLDLVNQHNAANDAMAQLVSALFIAIQEYRQRTPTDLQPANDVPAADLMQTLSSKAKATHLPIVIGTYIHCERCGNDEHVTEDCKERVGTCKRCLGYNRHVTAKCWCSAKDEKLEEQRLANYKRTEQNLKKMCRKVPKYKPLAESGLSRVDHILEPLTPRGSATIAAPENQTTATEAEDAASTDPVLPGTNVASSSESVVNNSGHSLRIESDIAANDLWQASTWPKPIGSNTNEVRTSSDNDHNTAAEDGWTIVKGRKNQRRRAELVPLSDDKPGETGGIW